jgi:hypothetical protein
MGRKGRMDASSLWLLATTAAQFTNLNRGPTTRRRPCGSRDPYSAAPVLKKAVRRLRSTAKFCGYGSPRSRGRRKKRHTSAISRRDAPELCMMVSPELSEGAGNAGRLMRPQPRMQNKKAYERSHHGHAEIIRHSPRNGFNGFLRDLPGDRACCHRHRRDTSR